MTIPSNSAFYCYDNQVTSTYEERFHNNKTQLIDSLLGLIFRNHLMCIMLVMSTGQHLHAKTLKLDDVSLERMAKNM